MTHFFCWQKNTFFLWLLFLLSVTYQVEAQQKFIVVEKVFSNKQVVYSSGDDIKFKLKEENFYRTNHIISLNDTAIVFHYYTIAYHEIDAVDISGHRFGTNLRGIGGTLQFVGLAYIAIDQFNQVVVRGEDASFNENIWLAGGAVFAGGTILKLMSPRKLKLGGKYRIRYMNITPL
jgi:hypothetical protein